MKLSRRKIASLFAIFPMGFMVMTAQAQEENLVQNPGFEEIEGKLKSLGRIENAIGWSSPTGVRADIFTPSKIPDINVPENLYGKEDAQEGANYAGIVAFSYGDAMPRSYLLTKLTTPLKKGMKYCVSFNLSLAESSKYSCNQIGVNFAAKPFGTDSKTAIIEKTHVMDPNNKVFSAMYNWEKVCNVFTAEGGEKYMTIGNFSSNENTKNEKSKKTKDVKKQVIAAYYYIDNVKVTMLTEEAVCECPGGASQEDNYSTTVYQKVVNLNDKMSPKEKIELQTLYYGFGRNLANPAGTASLDLIVEVMKANPDLKLEIMGHSDKTEDEAGAEKPMYAELGNKRVAEVMQYLLSKGVAESRLIATPMGSAEENPEASETDDEDLRMAKNRRVSFKVR